MKNYILLFLALAFTFSVTAQEKAEPWFKDGEAQIVPAFENQKDWIRTDLWVETTFDTDGDGKPDRSKSCKCLLCLTYIFFSFQVSTQVNLDLDLYKHLI